MSDFLRWVTLTHTQRYHAHDGTSGQGHVYQGRFKSFPTQDDEHFFVVARYVERNAVRANLVERADDWQWGSLARQALPRSKNAVSLASRSASQLGLACQRTA